MKGYFRLTGLFVFILCGPFTTLAQTAFEVPPDGVLIAKEDYEKYESTIIGAAKWLEETDLNKESEKRLLVMDFVLRWLSGSGTVNIEVTEPIGRLYEKNDPLLGIFLASYARHALENRSTPSRFGDTRAAVLSMIVVYKKGISIRKSKPMELAIKAAAENKLDSFISDVIHIPGE